MPAESSGFVLRGRPVVAGIVVFLSVGSPSAGTDHPSSTTWWITGIIVVIVVGLLARIGLARSGAIKAALLGSADGVAFAFQASVTKVFVGIVGGGISAILHSSSTYALIASALIGGVLQQMSLKTGILAPAMSCTSAVTLFGSIILGAVIFGETLAHGSGQLAPAIIGLLVALGGISLLAGSVTPPSDIGHSELQKAPAS